MEDFVVLVRLALTEGLELIRLDDADEAVIGRVLREAVVRPAEEERLAEAERDADGLDAVVRLDPALLEGDFADAVTEREEVLRLAVARFVADAGLAAEREAVAGLAAVLRDPVLAEALLAVERSAEERVALATGDLVFEAAVILLLDAAVVLLLVAEVALLFPVAVVLFEAVELLAREAVGLAAMVRDAGAALAEVVLAVERPDAGFEVIALLEDDLTEREAAVLATTGRGIAFFTSCFAERALVPVAFALAERVVDETALFLAALLFAAVVLVDAFFVVLAFII